MTHEPECLWQNEAMPPRAEVCRDCVIARAAYQRGYQRGRENAAKAVEAAEAWYDIREINPDGTVTNYMEQAVAIAAARGDGEQNA